MVRDEDTASTTSAKSNKSPLINELLSVEQILFTIPSDSEKVMTWQVVQSYRSVVIATIRTFLISPIIRNLVYLPALTLFLVYDRTSKPFKHPYMNVLQTLSTLFLLLIAVCNIVASFSLMTDVTPIPNIQTLLKTLKYIEAHPQIKLCVYTVQVELVDVVGYVRISCTRVVVTANEVRLHVVDEHMV